MSSGKKAYWVSQSKACGLKPQLLISAQTTFVVLLYFSRPMWHNSKYILNSDYNFNLNLFSFYDIQQSKQVKILTNIGKATYDKNIMIVVYFFLLKLNMLHL